LMAFFVAVMTLFAVGNDERAVDAPAGGVTNGKATTPTVPRKSVAAAHWGARHREWNFLKGFTCEG